jgi:hypothetical protein
MRVARTALLLALPVVASRADQAVPEGDPFRPPQGIQLVWAAQTNALPLALWIYQIMPTAFSAAQMTNAAELADFRIAKLSASPVPIPDKHLSYFQDRGQAGVRHLAIAPSIGCMEYYGAFSMKEGATNVPSIERANQLAFECLLRLGIDRSQLVATGRAVGTSTRGKLDQEGRKLTEEVVRRGASFVRRIDGYETSGLCFLGVFGNDGKITQFSLVWRNLLPCQLCKALTPSQIADAIRAGAAIAPPQDFNFDALAQAKRLAITKATPFYFDPSGMTALEYLAPYVQVDISVETGPTNSLLIVKLPMTQGLINKN